LQERVNRLSAENKERLIREYVRKKIGIMILEGPNDPNQSAPEPEPPAEPEPSPEPEPAPESEPTKGLPGQFQDYVLEQTKESTNPEDTLCSVFLNMLEDTLNKHAAQSGKEINKELVDTNIRHWLSTNYTIGNKHVTT